MNKTPVLFFTDTLYRLAGAERNLFEIVSRLSQDRFKSTVVCFRGGDAIKYFHEIGIEVINLNQARIYTLGAFFKALWLASFIKKKGIKVVVTYHEGSDFFASLLARLCGVPVLVSSRRDMGYRLKKNHIFLYKRINCLFDRIVTVSDAVKNVIFEREGAPWHKLITVHNGVESAKFCAQPDVQMLKASFGIPENIAIVGILAALRRIKGHRFFIDAASIILKEFPRVHFVIATWADDNDYYRELKEHIKQLGIENNFTFIIGCSEANKILPIFDISVLSSINEGFPNAVLESMAARKPVVATRAGGTEEAVIHEKTGLLVPPRDSGTLAKSILKLLRDQELSKRMGECGRETALDKFEIKVMIRKIESIFEQLLEENTSVNLATRTYLNPQGILKRLFATALFYSGGLFLFNKIRNAPGVKILAFHQVSNERFDPLFMKIRIEIFEDLIRYLKKNYTILPLREYFDRETYHKAIDKNSIVITFDDGYRDNYLNAYPILKKYNVPATLFLSAEAVNNNSFLWYDTIVSVFKNTRKNSIELRLPESKKYQLVSLKNKYLAIRDTIAYAKNLPPLERDAFINSLLKLFDENRITKSKCSEMMLSWEMVKEMHETGITFGSHGLTHTRLINLSKEAIEKEVHASKKLIEEQGGAEALFFAYPNGQRDDFEEITEDILRSNSYLGACTLIKGENASFRPFAMQRYCITQGMVVGINGKFSKSVFEYCLNEKL